MLRVVFLGIALLCISASASDQLSMTVDFYALGELNYAKVEQARRVLAQELSQGEISIFHENKSQINGSISLCVEAKTDASLKRIRASLKNEIASEPGSSEYPYPLITLHPNNCDVELSQRNAPYAGGGCYR